VMTGNAAADLHPHLGRRQFELVLEDGDVAGRDLEEVGRLLHGAAGLVHVGRGLEQHDALAVERAFRGLALKTTAPWCEAMTPCLSVTADDPVLVPVPRLFRAGITGANKESHDAASRVRLLLLVPATGGRLRARRWSSTGSRGRSTRGRSRSSCSR